jgi:hypothetical protein
MSGLLLRSHMNAGQDGFRDMGPNRSSTSTATVRNGVSYISDRSITPSVRFLQVHASDQRAGNRPSSGCFMSNRDSAIRPKDGEEGRSGLNRTKKFRTLSRRSSLLSGPGGGCWWQRGEAPPMRGHARRPRCSRNSAVPCLTNIADRETDFTSAVAPIPVKPAMAPERTSNCSIPIGVCGRSNKMLAGSMGIEKRSPHSATRPAKTIHARRR